MARKVVVDFERDGFVVVEDALDTRTVERLTGAVDRVWAAERPDGAALHLLGFLGRDPEFVALIDNPSAFPLVYGLLGWNMAQVAALDPVRRKLVGGGTSAIGYWIPTEEDVPLRAIG